jgi:DNA-directed RNA polymerase specialized sigma24 family protein
VAAPEPVLGIPVDESVFGVFDTAGSAAEWCLDWYEQPAERRHYAGGAWAYSDDGAAPLPADTSTGPATMADRLEQLTLATRALALLLDRDRDLVRWSCDGLPVADMAERLAISEEAAGKARQRAVERLRKAHRLVSGA